MFCGLKLEGTGAGVELKADVTSRFGIEDIRTGFGGGCFGVLWGPGGGCCFTTGGGGGVNCGHSGTSKGSFRDVYIGSEALALLVLDVSEGGFGGGIDGGFNEAKSTSWDSATVGGLGARMGGG